MRARAATLLAVAMSSALAAVGGATVLITPRDPPPVRAIDVELSPRGQRAEKPRTRHTETRDPPARVSRVRRRPAASAVAPAPRRQAPPPPPPVSRSPRLASPPPAPAPAPALAGDDREADDGADDNGGEERDDGGDDD